MNRRAGFDIQNYLVTFLVFTGILVTFGTIAYNMGQDYSTVSSVSIDDDFTNSYDKIGSITEDTNDMYGQFEDADVGDEDSDTQFYGGALKTARISFNSITLVQSVIQDMSEDLYVPEPWPTIFKALIVILLFTAILFMIFKFRG